MVIAREAAGTVTTYGGLQQVLAIIIIRDTAQIRCQDMLALIAAAVALLSIAHLQIVGLGHTVAYGRCRLIGLTLKCLSCHHIQMMTPHGSLISKEILHQCIGIAAVSLVQRLIALGEIVCRTLYERGDECKVRCKCPAV